MFEYKAELVRIIDGDTIVFDIDLGFGIWVRDEHVRLARINCPETRTKDLDEKQKGLEAKSFVTSHISSAEEIILKTYKSHGKFGRYIADVMIKKSGEWYCLNDLIVLANFAIYWDY